MQQLQIAISKYKDPLTLLWKAQVSDPERGVALAEFMDNTYAAVLLHVAAWLEVEAKKT